MKRIDIAEALLKLSNRAEDLAFAVNNKEYGKGTHRCVKQFTSIVLELDRLKAEIGLDNVGNYEHALYKILSKDEA